MKNRFLVENFYATSLNGVHSLVIGVDGELTVATNPTIADGKEFFVILDPLNESKRQIIRCYMDGSDLKYYGWSINSNVTYGDKTTVSINDVAELFNILYKYVDDFGYVEDTGGLTVRVAGGKVLNTSQADDNIDDDTFTLTDNTTNYIYFDNLNKEFAVSTTEPVAYWICAKVTTASGNITAIEDFRSNNVGVGAELLQLTQAEINALTGVKYGTIVYNKTTGLPQYYSGGSWYEISTGTVTPRLSETVEGKARYSTDLEFTAGSDTGSDSAPLVNKPSQVKGYIEDEISDVQEYVDDALDTLEESVAEGKSTLTNSDRLAGEDLTQGDSLFVEKAVTFASATNSQNIGDVTANTRVAIRAIGSGVAANTLKLALAKVSSPSANLGIRIETDNAGSPSGTLVDANATSTVTPGSLTTSLADTTATLAGSITIPKGDVVRVVLFAGTYGSETVNGTNYFKVGYNSNNTSTRYGKLWDGSVWGGLGSPITDAHGGNINNSGSTTQSSGFKFIALKNIAVNQVYPRGSVTATRALLLNSSGGILETATISGGIATFSGLTKFSAGDTFRIELDSNGLSYTSWTGSASFPYNKTNVSYTTGSVMGTDSNGLYNINSVITTEIYEIPSTIYISSSLFETSLLSKTDARYTYKLPDIPRIATDDYSTGDVVKYDFEGITKALSGLTKDSTYYISNTPGALSTSAGTNSYAIGIGLGENELFFRVSGYISTSTGTYNSSGVVVSIPTRAQFAICYIDTDNYGTYDTRGQCIVARVGLTTGIYYGWLNSGYTGANCVWSGNNLTITGFGNSTTTGTYTVYFYSKLA